MSKRALAPLCVMLSCMSGCVLWMREPAFYESELTTLLESENEAIAACYDRYLETQDDGSSGSWGKGEVVVNFEVAAKTGQLGNIALDSTRTTAPEALQACVLEPLGSLKLDPPDANLGKATYTWTFAPGSRKQPPADPFAGVQTAVLECYATHLREVDRQAQGTLVVDYAFNKETGTVETLEVVADGTTAPEPVVSCATTALRSATIAPDELDDRNSGGRRSFALRFTPYVGEG